MQGIRRVALLNHHRGRPNPLLEKENLLSRSVIIELCQELNGRSLGASLADSYLANGDWFPRLLFIQKGLGIFRVLRQMNTGIKNKNLIKQTNY